MAVKPKAKRADLDALIESSTQRTRADLSLEAKADLGYIADRAAQGSQMRWEALRTFMKERHGIEAGKARLATLVRSVGRKPWWA